MKVGSRLRSKTSTVEVIVVKAAASASPLTCGGDEMVPPAEAPAVAGGGEVPDEDKVLLGKRYRDAESAVEVLCTKAGAGPLSIDGRRLVMAEAKLLPSSD